jgi:hypothetical protein
VNDVGGEGERDYVVFFFAVGLVLLVVTVCGLALNPVVRSDLHTI